MSYFAGGRLCLIAVALTFASFLCHASDKGPYTGPANWGGTGLMETPTARILKEDRYRFGASQVHPYRTYYVGIGAFDRLEVTGRVTEVLGVKASSSDPVWKDYGNYKDKAIDIKFQVIPEWKYTPAVAIGLMDPHGTRIYSSQYIAASKQIYPFDFTVGFGNGRFGKKPLPAQGEGFKAEMFSDTKGWMKDSQFFGGIEFAPSEKYALMAEYSPIKYHKQTNDPARNKYFKGPVPSPYNFGVRWRPFKWSEMVLSYQRGNEIGLNFSMAFGIGNPMIPIYDSPYREGPDVKGSPLAARVTHALQVSGFSDIAVFTQDSGALTIEAQNDRYFYSTRAIGVILGLLEEILPEGTGAIDIVLHRGGMPLFKFATTREDIADLHQGRMELWEFFLLSGIDTSVRELSGRGRQHKRLFDYGIKPDFKTFLNDPSGFFKYRAGVAGWLGLKPWKGATFYGELLAYPLNTVSTSNEPLSRAVRSDIVPYLEENVILSKLLFSQIGKFAGEIYTRFAAGLLDVQYAGVDGEIAKPLKKGRFMVGASGSFVRKREPGKAFELKDDDFRKYYHTAFLNTRLNIPEKEISIDVMAGRFLAGDTGARVTVSKFIKGVTISAWYSLTNTSIFKDPYNRGYHDKGIRVTIPMRLFEGRDSRAVLGYALSPWTRDVAQDIDHYNSLFDYIGRDSAIYLDRDKEWMQ